MHPQLDDRVHNGVGMMYKCFNCGKDVEISLKTAKKVICPHCGYRILIKARPKVAKVVKAT